MNSKEINKIIEILERIEKKLPSPYDVLYWGSACCHIWTYPAYSGTPYRQCSKCGKIEYAQWYPNFSEGGYWGYLNYKDEERSAK